MTLFCPSEGTVKQNSHDTTIVRSEFLRTNKRTVTGMWTSISLFCHLCSSHTSYQPRHQINLCQTVHNYISSSSTPTRPQPRGISNKFTGDSALYPHYRNSDHTREPMDEGISDRSGLQPSGRAKHARVHTHTMYKRFIWNSSARTARSAVASPPGSSAQPAPNPLDLPSRLRRTTPSHWSIKHTRESNQGKKPSLSPRNTGLFSAHFPPASTDLGRSQAWPWATIPAPDAVGESCSTTLAAQPPLLRTKRHPTKGTLSFSTRVVSVWWLGKVWLVQGGEGVGDTLVLLV